MTSRLVTLFAFAVFVIASSFCFAKGGPGPIQSPPNGRAVIDPDTQLDNLPPDLEFEPGVIIVKFKDYTRDYLSKHSVALPSLSPRLAEYGVFKMTQMYPRHEEFLSKSGNQVALDRMYRIEFSGNVNPLDVAKDFQKHPDVEYAEPEVVDYLFYQPNDPRYSEQYMHQLINTEAAWDITTGSEAVVIGIVDSGVNWNHEDLEDNIWVNPGEDIDHDGKYTMADINGVDDDNNGYIDDIIGIDFIGEGNQGGDYYDVDPQPTPAGNPHGTHVAGIAAGVGDNGKGIAGVAFTSKIMPVKCGTDVNSRRISRGYDGIVYAADNGAQIINCSWGGGGYLASQNERIEYAISQGALVVAAAGNSGMEYISTPGAYPNVLCVANVDQDDKVAPSSTFGPWVDVSAPGTQILSCISTTNSAYAAYTGTSMASPVVAGLAALVLSHNPSFTPLQIGEQIRVSSEDIDDLNPYYRQKIGKGRVDASRALTISSAAIRLLDWSYSDAVTGGNANMILDQGETFSVTMTWQNLLAPAIDASITLSSPNPRITIENPDFYVGPLATMETVTNASQPFIIHIADEYAPNDKIDLIYTITDGEYQDQGGVYVLQQPTYRDHDINKIHVTLSNDGNIGYDDFNGMRGSGFVYDNTGDDVLFEGAFMLTASFFTNAIVQDVGRDETGYSQSDNFRGQTLYEMNTPGTSAPQQGFGFWNDANTPLDERLFLDITLDSYAFTEPGLDNCIFLKYTIRNQYDVDYTNCYAGLFFDWDISDNAYSDYAGFDSLTRAGFALDTSGGVSTHVGVAVLTNDSLTNYWALSNGSRDDSVSIGIYNGFTKEEKLRALSSGIGSPSAGVSDISQIISNGPYILPAEDSIIVGFVLMAGYSTEEVLATVPKARAKWDSVIHPGIPSSVAPPITAGNSIQISSMYPQPLSRQIAPNLNVTLDVATKSVARVQVSDVLGRILFTVVPQEYAPGHHYLEIPTQSLKPGLYHLSVFSENRITSRPFVIEK